MNLVEAMVASAMFVTSSSCSLQLWSGSASWARQAEAQQQQAAQLEAALLASQAQLTALAGTTIAADCTAASSWLVAHLQSLPSGEGIVRQVSTEPGALVRLQVAGAGGVQRQRWLSPAAYGLCGSQPAAEPSDATT
ncbi:MULTISPECIES: hypothetical protein [unclassified Cyanobium]|uniref:hypothetical protein n=1 Tax=unclassified Cyanobium TaxID=2627006 RepID=UPI0020CCF7C8|nr:MULTISPECIES: hypothetical protein [unclassified Cyanobium]MCP9777009.1 hypothetical protein [Cyanobium sp. Tous-M-B4]MCP9875275.1 hypothetical protein [Cyanobium sp. A2C-AMD]